MEVSFDKFGFRSKIAKQKYNSIRDFCTVNGLNYNALIQAINRQTISIKLLVEISRAMNCRIEDLLIISE